MSYPKYKGHGEKERIAKLNERRQQSNIDQMKGGAGRTAHQYETGLMDFFGKATPTKGKGFTKNPVKHNPKSFRK